MNTQLVYYRTEEGVKTAIVVPARKILHVIMIGGTGLIHRSVQQDQERYMRPLDQPLKKAVTTFGGIAKRKGSTKEARTWLARARRAAS